MKRRHSRIFAVILAAALALTMLPPLAFAEGDPQGAAPAPDGAAQSEPSPGQDSAFGLLPDAGDDEAQEGPEPAADELAEQTAPALANEPTPGQDDLASADELLPEQDDNPVVAPDADDVTESVVRAEAGSTLLVPLASESGSISGTITDSEGAIYGMEFPTAFLYKGDSTESGGYWWRIDSVPASESDGSYRFDDLEPGVYLVSANHDQFTAESYYSTGGSVYFQNEATPVTVVAGQDSSGIDIRIQRAGVIQGTVTPSEALYNQGQGIVADIRAIPWDVETSVLEGRRDYAALPDFIGPGSIRGYYIGGLPPGTYKLQFSPHPSNVYAGGYYVDDASPLAKSAAEGAVITVVAGDVLYKNIVTAQAYRIEGTAPASVDLGNGLTARIDTSRIFYYDENTFPSASGPAVFSVAVVFEGTAQKAGKLHLGLEGQPREAVYRVVSGVVDTDSYGFSPFVPPTSVDGSMAVLDLSQLAISGRFEPGVEITLDNSGQQPVNGITHTLGLSESDVDGKAAFIPGEELEFSVWGMGGSAAQTGRYAYRLIMNGSEVVATLYGVVEAGDSAYGSNVHFRDAGLVAPSEDATYSISASFEPIAFALENGSATFDIGNGVTLGFVPDFGVDGDGNIVVLLDAELSGTAAGDALHKLSFTYDDAREVRGFAGLDAIAVQQGAAVVNCGSYRLEATFDPSGSNVFDVSKLNVAYTLDTDVSRVTIHNSWDTMYGSSIYIPQGFVNGIDINFSRGFAASDNTYAEISGHSIANDVIISNPDNRGMEDVMLAKNGTVLYLAASGTGTAEATGAIDYNLSVDGSPLAGASQRLFVNAGESEWGAVGFYAPDSTFGANQKHFGTPFAVVIGSDTVISLDATFVAGAIRTVAFDVQGGSPVESRPVLDGTAVGELPSTARDSYDFAGWFTAPAGGSKVSAATEVTGDATYYAHWEERTVPKMPELTSDVDEYGNYEGSGDVTVSIDAPLSDFVRLTLDGGEVAAENYTLAPGSTVVTFKESYLKTLVPGSYTFVAEFSGASGGYAAGTVDIPLMVLASDDETTTGGTDSSSGGGSTTGTGTGSGGSGGGAGTLPTTGDAASLGLMALAALLAATGTCLVARRGQPQRRSIYRSGARQGR
jgi:uncharacterized repeat protein (TIGR02543 family)